MTKIAKISLNTLFMTKIAEKPYSPYKGVLPPLPLGVMHSNIFLFEVTNITVLLCNPGLIIIHSFHYIKLAGDCTKSVNYILRRKLSATLRADYTVKGC